MTPGEEIRLHRIQKTETLKKSGVDPYPEKISFPVASIADIRKKFKTYARAKKTVGIAGRIMAKREHGGSIFLDIFDGSTMLTINGSTSFDKAQDKTLTTSGSTDVFQVFIGKDKIGENSFSLFVDTADVGDFVAISGKLFVTKRGEETLEATKWEMLTKTLRPLPEKWHGLSDTEERFRKRYLDLVMNPEVRARFVARSAIVHEIRNFFDTEKFMEVETPMLHPIAGGALARPFRTHHNALDIDLYLRIAPELYLKKLLVGGFRKVYEIGKSFRNEGIDPRHNPEFTTIEWYAAYWDEEDMMDFTEKCFKYLVKKITGGAEFAYQEQKISCAGAFQRLPFKEVLKRHAQILDYDKESRESLVLKARQFGIEPEAHESKGKIADEIYKKVCRPKMIQPTFLTNHPLDISPLAKKHAKPDEVRRFQLIIGGLELVNAFSELNDPIDQLERFTEQDSMKKAGEMESHPVDEDFVEALEYGMPPAAGAAIGIDRLVMLLTDTESIKEVILFPTMRPK